MGRNVSDFEDSMVQTGDHDGSLDSPHLLQAMSRHKRFIIGSTLAGLLLSCAFVTLVKARFTAEATLLVENQETYFNRVDPTTNNYQALPPDAEAVQTQVQLVQSRDVARRAIKQLNLIGNPEFDPLSGVSSALGRVEILLGLKTDPSKMTREDGILTNYYQRLAVLSPEKTRVVTVDFTSNNAELAARGANTIAQIYIDQQISAKRSSAKASSDTLAGQIDTLKLRLAQAQAKAEQFRLQAGLLVGTNNLTVSAQQLGDINTQLSTARAAQADAGAKAQLIRKLVHQGHISEIPDVANNGLIRTVYAQRIALSAQLASESRTLLPGHPKIKELRAQLMDIDAQLRNAAEKTARTLANEASLAAMKVKNLELALNEQKQVAGSANEDEVTLNKYDNDARLIKNELDDDVTKYQAAKARQDSNSTPADARVVSQAIVPNIASFPRKIPIVSVSTLAGLIFSAAFVVARELLMAPSGEKIQEENEAPLGKTQRRAPGENDGKNDGENDGEGVVVRKEAERKHHLEPTPIAVPPAFVDVPTSVTQTKAVDNSSSKPDSNKNSNSFASMTGKIEATGHRGEGTVTQLITPDVGNQARGQLASDAISLARELSKTQRTILVNLNPDLTWVDDLVDGQDDVGLTELLAGATSFAEVIHRDVSSRLHVLRYGGGDLEDHTGLDHVLDALCETYQQIVLIGPEYGLSDMDITLAAFSDFALISTIRRADDPAIAAIERELLKAGAAHVQVLSPNAHARETTAA